MVTQAWQDAWGWRGKTLYCFYGNFIPRVSELQLHSAERSSWKYLREPNWVYLFTKIHRASYLTIEFLYFYVKHFMFFLRTVLYQWRLLFREKLLIWPDESAFTVIWMRHLGNMNIMTINVTLYWTEGQLTDWHCPPLELCC